MSPPSPVPDPLMPLPRIRVLLASYNGAAFIDAQLDSIAGQQVDAVIDVVASDDGSVDGTKEILARWRDAWCRGAFEIVTGPGKGFAENFRSLMAARDGQADYLAFSDQDDVWMDDKLAVALSWLGGRQGPALYCSRTLRVDQDLAPTGHSPLFRRPPSFRNALVQSIAGGNTMVLNAAAFDLVANSARRTAFVGHDWWSYQVVSGAGGEVFYDPVPHILYRQHGGNAVGDNVGWRARLRRLQMSLEGRFATWNEVNLAGLHACSDLLTEDARETVRLFALARGGNRFLAPYLLWRSGIYRQGLAGNISLALAAILGKL